jgi:predicted RND superfamily exporter protein
MEKPTFFARRALLILVVVFFLVPFALRGARMALQGMKNDVKDWLPSEFEETKDLDEFRRYFLSEQFVIASWDGCYGDATDERFKLFLAKLTPETPPSIQAEADAAELDDARSESLPHQATSANLAPADPNGKIQNPTLYIHRDNNFIGDKLGLYSAGNWHTDWGQRREKWLKGRRLEAEGSNGECWYYITPDGDLYRWEGVDSPFASLARRIRRWLVGPTLEGTLMYAFGPLDGAWYHADPRRLRAQLFKTVTTGPDVLASMTAEGGELSGSDELREEAERRLSRVLFGPDGKTTCIMVTLTDAARRNLHLVCGRGLLGKPRGRLFEIAEESNISEDDLRLGGPPVDNVAIDEEGSITLVRLVTYSVGLGLVLSMICFRSISATIMIFFVGGISAITSIALVWWCGSSVDAIMMSMPSLVYVLGLSGAAHIINYYHEAVEQHGHIGAPERAVAHGWKPAFLCQATTAIGLVTLVTSELVPIRKFGFFSALAVMAMFVVLLSYLPAALQIWPQNRRKRIAHDEDRPCLDRLLSGFWQRMGGWIVNHHGFVAIACTVVIVAFGYGLVHMRTNVNLLKMFHSEAKIIKDYAWLEENLGQLVPMEVVVRVPKDDQRPPSTQLASLQDELASADITPARKAEIEQVLAQTPFQMPFLERMEMAARVQRLLEDEFGPEGRNVVGRAISAATFVRPLPFTGGSTLTYSQRSTTSGRLESHRDEFLHSDYLRISKEDEAELWRVSLRVSATKNVDYGAFVSDLQQTVEPVIAAQHQREAILRQLADHYRQRGERERPLGNSRVLLVGMPAGANGHSQSDNGSANKIGSQAAETSTAQNPLPIDQHKIFARTLRDLLTISRLRLTAIASDNSEPLNLEQTRTNYDCVVLIGDLPGLDLTRLKQAAPLLIDVRNHTYAPGTMQKTAWQRDPASVAAVYTGVVPIVYKAQRMLLDSLIQSTFWSVVMITPLLMWIARSFAAGAVSMLPNVLPILMVFGGMGWLGIDVDVGSMMTASIALGVAVDDTIHYLNWFRYELDILGDRKKAIVAAYRHCATPTLQAAVISGLGLSIFALSTFTPTQRFGVLMLVILWLGAVAELIYFPALLAGPLGRVFKPRRKPSIGHGPSRRDLAEPLVVRQPQLQIVRPEEPAEEMALAIVDGNGDEPAIASPHALASNPELRQFRPDAPHRRA